MGDLNVLVGYSQWWKWWGAQGNFVQGVKVKGERRSHSDFDSITMFYRALLTGMET